MVKDGMTVRLAVASGPKARTCDVEWIRAVMNQCRLARTPVFLKQVGARLGVATKQEETEWKSVRDPKGGEPSEWPKRFRVRQFPRATEGGVA